MPPVPGNHFAERIFLNEWGIALEILYAVLCEEKIPITKSIYDTVTSVGEIMGMDYSTWESLKYLII